MKYQSGLPWYKIQDYIVELGSQTSIPMLFAKSLERLPELVPYDVTSNLFMNTGEFCIYDNKEREKWNSLYNSYYAFINPTLQLDFNIIKWVDWREYRHTEIATDFIFPQGIRYMMMHYSFRFPIHVALYRTRESVAFKDRDHEILTIITPHLNNIYSYLTKISKLEAFHQQAVGLAKECRLLSKREAEVAGLLCQRLTMAEIATKLMLSPRTVETHVENIKEKLGVRNRRELLAKLLKSG